MYLNILIIFGKVFKIEFILFFMKRKKRIRKEEVITYSFILLFLFIMMIGLYQLGGGITGFAVYEQDEQTEFDEGTYSDAEWNGSAVVLSRTNLTGVYTSKIFDAGADAIWNNLSAEYIVSQGFDNYLVSAFHSGSNVTEVFDLDETYYLADMKDPSKIFYLNFSDDLINNSVLKIYAKKDNGVTIGIYALSDSAGVNPFGIFIVDSVTGEWYNVTLNIDSSTNTIWIGEGIGSGTDPKDEFDYVYAEIPGSNLSFQVKNCSASDCSDASFVDADLDNLNLVSQYFQYQVSFSSPASGTSPGLSSVALDYDLLDSSSPQISFSSSTEEAGEYNQDWINVGVDVIDDSQTYSFINFDNSLISFWKLNDTGATIKDYSGNNYDGTINGAISTTGKFGDAIEFGSGDYINFGNINSFERTDNFSYSFWMNTDSTTSYITIISKTPYGSWHGQELFVVNGKLRLYLIGAAEQIEVSSTAIVNTGSWKHIIINYDGSNSASGVDIYVDGVEGSSGSGTLTTSIVNSNNFQISGRAGNNNCFEGVIDEVLIFDRVLSGDEISALYSASSYSNNFTDLGVGDYEFYAYAQDVYGNENQTEVRTVSLTDNMAPAINLIEPQNQLYLSNESLALDLTVVDSEDNLDSCWYNLDGGENTSLESCANTTFDVFGDGNYVLTIYANDSLGLESSDSVGFDVDSTGVSVLVTEPTGEKTSRTEISITYTATGDDLVCWYNVKTSVGGDVLDNTTLVNCTSSSFSVSTDGDYVFNLYVNNSFGSFDLNSSSFSVDTSEETVIVTPPSSGGGGGGGGGTVVLAGRNKVEITPLSNLVVNLGDTKKLTLNVKNIGTNFLNDCKIKASSWLSSDELKNLAAGEESDFDFDLNVLDDVESGEYTLEVIFECKGLEKSVDFIVEVIEQKLLFELINVERISDEEVKIVYLLEESSGIEQEVELQFLILGNREEKAAEIKETKIISANSKEEFEILISVDSALEGDLNLLVNLNSETYSTFVQENIILGSPISGFSVFGDASDSDNILSGTFIFLFLMFAFFMVRRILKHRKKSKK